MDAVMQGLEMLGAGALSVALVVLGGIAIIMIMRYLFTAFAQYSIPFFVLLALCVAAIWWLLSPYL